MEPYLIQSYQIYPVTEEVKQRLILSYLTPMGEYQEVGLKLLSHRLWNNLFIEEMSSLVHWVTYDYSVVRSRSIEGWEVGV